MDRTTKSARVVTTRFPPKLLNELARDAKFAYHLANFPNSIWHTLDHGIRQTDLQRVYHRPGRAVSAARPAGAGAVTARSEVYKELETSTDLALAPDDGAEPAMIAEFQGYLSETFIAKVMLRCALYRLRRPGRALRCHAIYLRRDFEWPAADDDSLFRPHVHYLPDLVRRLEASDPDSPLVSVLRPLVVDDPRELTSAAAADYQRISGSPALTPEQREVWLQMYYVWMMIRFENSLEELSKMVIAGLPPWRKLLGVRN